jgi:hypothetical protein
VTGPQGPFFCLKLIEIIAKSVAHRHGNDVRCTHQQQEGTRKMAYLVETSCGDTIGTFTSVKASLKAIENHWQCGTAQNIFGSSRQLKEP